MKLQRIQKLILIELLSVAFLFGILAYDSHIENTALSAASSQTQKDYIKWVEFNVTCEALKDAYQYDISTYKQKVHLNWISLLAYLAAKNGGDFSKYKSDDMNTLAEKLISGEETLENLTKDMKYYPYYLEAYTAVLGGMVGEYQIETENTSDTSASLSKTNLETRYGLKAFHPLAKNFPYSDYDDFGASRSYGYNRPHLGHDLMGQTGTPIVASESGYVEALGWNQYGGWRIGIRSFDKKRYYYYAHLRQNFPFNESLKEGSIVTAGDVIGYLGHTGYSATENVNNIDTPHLHFGIQLIFDESQKESTNEIWIDCYQLVRFLYQNRSETQKIEGTKEWCRILDMKDPAVEEYQSSRNSAD